MGALVACLAERSSTTPAIARRMLDAAPHRGNRVSIHATGRCAVGIADRDDGDASIAARGSLAAAVVGRIDDLPDHAARWGLPWRADLAAADVVLAGFERCGERSPAHLRGAYSAVVTDGSSLYAFRDHLGLVPLHFAAESDGAFVATEAKQVLAGTRRPREPEMAFLEALVFDRYDDETLCALKGVRRVPQASLLTAALTGATWSRYWHPEELLETARLGDDEIQERFDALMARAVGRVLSGSDAVALSGGIDSPALAAYAAPLHLARYGRPLAAVSAVDPRFPGMDEGASVELVAKTLGLDLHVFRPRLGPLDGLRGSVRLADGPAPSSFSRPRELYRIARALGYRTILSGNYAELLTESGRAYLLAHLVRARRIGALRALFGREDARGVGASAMARQLARAVMPAALMDAYDLRRHAGRLGPDWLDPRRGASRTTPVPSRGRWRQAQLESFFAPRLSIEADDIEQVTSGVRVRWPWADVDLWEFFLRLPAETKCPDVRPPKLLVRRLLRGRLPDPILGARKVVVDDAAMRALVDYPLLRELLSDPTEKLPGVDYARLREHLEREDVPARDMKHLRVLAATHVFLDEWR